MKFKQLSRARKINAAVFAAMVFALSIYVYCAWSEQGCEGFCLWAGVIGDGSMLALIGFCCDRAIRDIENKNKIDKYEYN